MRIENQIAYLDGRVTQIEARQLLADGEAAIDAGCKAVDLASVQQVDSSALSLLLAWQRHASQTHRELAFLNIPQSLHSLVDLYGVGDLLPTR